MNADEITVHQINSILAQSQNVAPDAAPRAKREILEKLIDQQLARQQAIEKKLDRTPAVMQTLEAARSEILARAYREQILAAQPKPTEEQIKQYYAAHPELFAQRRIFNLEEIALMSTPGVADGLRAQVAKARSMQELADWLKSREAKYSANRGTRAAEQIPLELLPQLQAMKDGEIRLIENGNALYVFRVVARQEAPVDEAAAAPRIQQFLFNQHASEVLVNEMKRLRAKSTIDYVGESAPAASESKPVTAIKPAAPPQAAPATTAEPAAKAAAPTPEPPPASNIEKGVRGLR